MRKPIQKPGWSPLPSVVRVSHDIEAPHETSSLTSKKTRKPVGTATAIDNHLTSLYFGMYAFAVLTFVVGVYMVFFPAPIYDIPRRISGCGLFVCGTMLMMNQDLVITTLRMWVQLRIFKANNRELEALNGKYEEQVRALEKCQGGLDKLEKDFGNELTSAQTSLASLESTSQSRLRDVAAQLSCKFVDLDQNGKVEHHEILAAFEIFKGLFHNVVADFDQRCGQLRAALETNQRFQQKKALKGPRFSRLVEQVLLSQDVSVDAIAGTVNEIIAERWNQPAG